MQDEQEPFDTLPDDLPSKSQLKREANALQDLGADLLKLSAKELATMPMPDTLADALEHARNIKSHAALRRQMQYIGKVMRTIDAEPIQQALDKIRLNKRHAADQFHHIERWRDRLIGEGDTALSEFLEQHPNADRQQLRQYMLNAQKELKQNKPPKSARNLFRYLRELLEQA